MADQQQQNLFLQRLEELVGVSNEVEELKENYRNLHLYRIESALRGVVNLGIEEEIDELLANIIAKSELKTAIIIELKLSDTYYATTEAQISAIMKMLQPVHRIYVPMDIQQRDVVKMFGEENDILILPREDPQED